MQERGATSTGTSMESTDSVDVDDSSSSSLHQETSTRSRNSNNLKLKVLVRSHAMRESSPSPPPPISASAATAPPAGSPRIKLTPSSDSCPTSAITLSIAPLSPTSPTRHHHHSPPDQSEFTTQEFHYSPHSQYDGNKSSSRGKHQSVRSKKHNNYYDQPQPQQQFQQQQQQQPQEAPKCDCLAITNNNNLHNNNNNNNTLAVVTSRGNGVNGRGKLRQQSSSFGSFEGSSPSLSRDNSSEQYTDTTGVDLDIFIPETLNRNPKDRNLMLRIEDELLQLAKDKSKTHFKFPPMSSYQRMLVHRCAAYFGMDHNIESSGKCVVVNKTKNTRIPDIEFKLHIKAEYTEEPKRSILKRDSNSVEDYGCKSPDRQYSLESRRSKSFEEREEEYERARRRIFKQGNHECSADDIAWPSEISWSNNDHDSKYRLHSDYHHHHQRPSRLLKVQSEDQGEETLRPCVAKSYSFGGYGGALTRGDSMMSTHSAGPRLFSKQDSTASSVSWRLSPSSSGYKTQSQRSESITPSPTSTPFFSSSNDSTNRQDSTATNASDLPTHHVSDESTPANDQQVLWAVTNIQSVPKGSVIINPATGQPIKNHDGTLYHHDPENPLPDLPQPQSEKQQEKPLPPVSGYNGKPPMSPAKSKSTRPVSPKKRPPPIKKMNSATSPSLPYTPPSQPMPHSLPALAMSVPAPPPLPVATQLVQTKSFPGYSEPVMQNQYYGATPYDYTQSCIVYAPYGQSIPVGYDRIESTQLQELPQTTFYVDNPSLAYQQPPPTANVWPQPQYIYSNTATAAPQPRYTVQPVQQQGYITSTCGYPGTAQSEMLPVFPPQPLIYPAQAQTTVFPNQSVYYAPPGTVFPQAPPPQQNLGYPVSAGTPNGGVYPVVEQVVQGMSQMHMTPPKELERRMSTPKGKCRSQSSTEASSPATAVMAYSGGVYHRQNSETPPSIPTTPGYGGSFPPMFIRQMSNVRASPPMQGRASRSPTPVTPTMAIPPVGISPGAEMMVDSRHRYPMPPPFVYQAMPYSIPSDSRIVSGRGQPNVYRQPSPRPPPSHQYQHHHPQTNVSINSNPNSNSYACTTMAQNNQLAAAAGAVDNKFRHRKNRNYKPIYAQYNNRKQSPN